MPGRDDEMNDPTVGAFLAVLAAKPASEIRIPAIMDLDLLPNIGQKHPEIVCGRMARSTVFESILIRP